MTGPPAPSEPDLDEVPLERAEGVELLGPLQGSGYRDGAALVRRGDGQIIQLGPLMYLLLEEADGRRSVPELAAAASTRLGRTLGAEQVSRLAEKLAAQGLLAGTEHQAPPRRSPLLALRWKVLVTDPVLTRRLTRPFAFLFRPALLWPAVIAFGVVCWFVLIQKGVGSATAQAFHSPGLLLLVFALSVLSAGFHELGHAAACRYAGATPGGMGVGLYLVWPAFYTDVTDAYRLPKRDRLRIDLAGLYFNAVVADLTMVVWCFWRVDALLLLVAVQILQMVKQLSPVIRADGYHILSDATGVPDLYAHMGPTLRRLLPGQRHQPSALTGRARLLVTGWVFIIVPVLVSLMLGAVLLMPKLATSAWYSGRGIAAAIPHQVADFQLVNLAVSVVRLAALVLPVAGSALVAQKMARTAWRRARTWSAGYPTRRAIVVVVASGLVALLAWAWWPAGQYTPVRANQKATLPGLVHLISQPAAAVRPGPATVHLGPGAHLAMAMIPTGGPSRSHPAYFVVPGRAGQPAAVLVSFGGGMSQWLDATAFPFVLPGPPAPGSTQALAVGTTDGGVTYSIAYALLTVSGGAPVTETNSAFAFARCRGCTTVAVSFQVILVVGTSDHIAPVNAAGALNYRCPACSTTAVADQLVVTLRAMPAGKLLGDLRVALARLERLKALGPGANPKVIAAQVVAVESQIVAELAASGLVVQPAVHADTTATASTTTTSVAGTSAGGSTTTVYAPPSPDATTTSTVPGSAPTPASSPATSSSTAGTSTTTTASSTSGASSTTSGSTTTTTATVAP